MNVDAPRIFAVVVTYNRKSLLSRCLAAISNQTHKPDGILVVDNASTDGTYKLLQVEGWLEHPNFELVSLNENTGGAGGFHVGLRRATEIGAQWVWMMDDDAEPLVDALECLVKRKLDPHNLYGSVAVCAEKLSWPMMPQGGRPKDTIYDTSELCEETDVQFIPFLGILISARMVQRIGLPDPGFFLAADDVDYCLRARSVGAQLILVGTSRINHPASHRYRLWLPGREFYSLELVPWKRYYDVRNRIFVARTHHGAKLWYSTIPGSFLRLLATLLHEQNRLQQLKAFYAGMADGLLGRKGRRHELWGIK